MAPTILAPIGANYYSLSGEGVVFGSLGSDGLLGGDGYRKDILVTLSDP